MFPYIYIYIYIYMYIIHTATSPIHIVSNVDQDQIVTSSKIMEIDHEEVEQDTCIVQRCIV
jgi:hypothetical protein